MKRRKKIHGKKIETAAIDNEKIQARTPKRRVRKLAEDYEEGRA